MGKATHCKSCGVELTEGNQSDAIRRANRALCSLCERQRKAAYAPKYAAAHNAKAREKRAQFRAENPKPTVEQRFEKLFTIDRKSGCWIWNGAISHWGGYGAFNYEGRTMLAHRASMLMFRGIDARELMVCHKCDNHRCVNPDHLFLGTHQDNVDDMVAKGRNSREQPAVERALNAKRVARRKLTEQQVLEIFERMKSGEKSSAVADEYGVVPSTIGHIMKGNTWSHVTGLSCQRHHWKD